MEGGGGGGGAGKRTGAVSVNHSCEACRRRKVRCDGSVPCMRCIKAGTECILAVSKRCGRPRSTGNTRTSGSTSTTSTAASSPIMTMTSSTSTTMSSSLVDTTEALDRTSPLGINLAPHGSIDITANELPLLVPPSGYIVDEVDQLVPPSMRQVYLDVRYTKLATLCDPIHFIVPLSVWTLSPVAPVALRLCYYAHLAWSARSLKHADMSQLLETRCLALISVLTPSIESILHFATTTMPHQVESIASPSDGATLSPSIVREALEIAVALATLANYFWGTSAKRTQELAALAQQLFALLRLQPNLAPYTDTLSLLTYQVDTSKLGNGPRPVNDEMDGLLHQADRFFGLTTSSMCAPSASSVSALMMAPQMTTEELPASWNYVPSAVPPPEEARLVQWSLVSACFVPLVPSGLGRAIGSFFFAKDRSLTALQSTDPSEWLRAPPLAPHVAMQYLSIIDNLDFVASDLPPLSWINITHAYVRSSVQLAAGNLASYLASSKRATRLLELKFASESLAFAPAYIIFPLYFACYVFKLLGIHRLFAINHSLLNEAKAMFPDQRLYIPQAFEQIVPNVQRFLVEPTLPAATAPTTTAPTTTTTTTATATTPTISVCTDERSSPVPNVTPVSNPSFPPFNTTFSTAFGGLPPSCDSNDMAHLYFSTPTGASTELEDIAIPHSPLLPSLTSSWSGVESWMNLS